MLPADTNDPHVVNHFNNDGHRVLALRYFIVIVVKQRQHHRTRAVAERTQASLRQRLILGVFAVMQVRIFDHHAWFGGRQTPIGGIGDERGPRFAVDSHDVVTRVDPGKVIAAARAAEALAALMRQIGGLELGVPWRGIRGIHLCIVAFDFLDLFGGHDQAHAVFLRALEHGQGRIGPGPFQIRLAIAVQRCFVDAGRGIRCRKHR